MKYLVFSAVLLLVGLGCQINQIERVGVYDQTQPAVLYPSAQLTFSNAVGSQLDVYIADEPAEQVLGLGDIDTLPNDQGMLFLYENYDRFQYWMKNVEYPIDIVWLVDGTIVDITQNVPPESAITAPADYKRYQPNQPVNQVLEVNAGYVPAHGIAIGDTIELRYYQ